MPPTCTAAAYCLLLGGRQRRVSCVSAVKLGFTGQTLTNHVTETFFLPEEISRLDWSVPSDIYNLSRTLLTRSEFNCAFVPIRSMQYLAVISGTEIVFVDSQAYACRDGEGGRLIMLAWKFDATQHRSSLNQPHDCHVVLYHPDSAIIQQRLVGDFRAAMEQLDRRFRDSSLPSSGARILPLK